VKLLAGTSGYSFKEWKGTFYRLPKESVLLEWASQVPEEFSFSIKASQKITHYTRLKAESESMVQFLLKNTTVLGSRLGPLLFQLPPNLKKDIPRLQNFLTYLPSDRRYTFEFRHESWWDEDVFTVLRDRDIAMCVSESAELTCPVVCTATWGYLRLHKLDYSPDALSEWAKRVSSQNWSEAYVYFKHDEGEGSGPPAVEAFVSATSSTPVAQTP
jgi:uncharacterized protein YecE (DUF72 family)